MTTSAASTAPSSAVAAVQRLNDAVNRGDADAVQAALTDDCVFEDTRPPDGERHEGSAAVRAFFQQMFDAASERSFEAEEIIEIGDRVVVRWLHRWVDRSGAAGRVRGVDVFAVRGGKVAEKLSYAKG